MLLKAEYFLLGIVHLPQLLLQSVITLNHTIGNLQDHLLTCNWILELVTPFTLV